MKKTAYLPAPAGMRNPSAKALRTFETTAMEADTVSTMAQRIMPVLFVC